MSIEPVTKHLRKHFCYLSKYVVRPKNFSLENLSCRYRYIDTDVDITDMSLFSDENTMKKKQVTLSPHPTNKDSHILEFNFITFNLNFNFSSSQICFLG